MKSVPMSHEVELKLLIPSNQRELAIRLCEQAAHGQAGQAQRLDNSYFDTPELELRQHDIGLRIRRAGEQLEQTLKLAGTTTGGLHSRPEYNVNVTEKTPDLSLYDESIWPESLPYMDLQRELIALFQTDFVRTRWQLASGEGQLEIAFDEGMVRANGHEQPICEIEIEVQGGEVADAFKLARRLITRTNAQVGYLSKAARGYLLAEKSQLQPRTRLDFVPLSSAATVASGLYQALAFALNEWQHNEACLLRQPDVHAVAGMANGMRLCRVVLQQLASHGVDTQDDLARLEPLLDQLGWLKRFEAFAELIADDGAYHLVLKEQQKLYDNIVDLQLHAAQLEVMQKLVTQHDYQLTVLELGELIQRAPQDEHMDTPMVIWAAQQLKQDWQNVADAFDVDEPLRAEQYLKLLPSLQSSLHLGYCVGYLFAAEDREQFRAPWLDMARGIREITALKLLRDSIKDTDDINQEKLLNWQQTQLESLLFALDTSRRAALKQEPYWIN